VHRGASTNGRHRSDMSTSLTMKMLTAMDPV
jgi:hypothetical protein